MARTPPAGGTARRMTSKEVLLVGLVEQRDRESGGISSRTGLQVTVASRVFVADQIRQTPHCQHRNLVTVCSLIHAERLHIDCHSIIEVLGNALTQIARRVSEH